MTENKKSDKPNNLEDLSSQERELILYIRHKFRYGEIVIQARDGEPYRIRKVTEFETLD